MVKDNNRQQTNETDMGNKNSTQKTQKKTSTISERSSWENIEQEKYKLARSNKSTQKPERMAQVCVRELNR